MEFKRATRRQAALKVAVTGPSGSGKTYSSLLLAFGLAGGGKVAVIDTERNSASLYEGLGEFDSLNLTEFTVDQYLKAIDLAVKAGYEVLVIDSLSHEWQTLLAEKESLDARGGNSYTNWASITKKHNAFLQAILQAPIHIIATMRSKQDYVLETDQRGKAAPKKVGLAPIQREGAEYEFTTVFDVAMNHEASVSKDRTELFDGKILKLGREHGELLRQWLEGGATPEPEPTNPATNGSHAAETLEPPLLTFTCTEVASKPDNKNITMILGTNGGGRHVALLVPFKLAEVSVPVGATVTAFAKDTNRGIAHNNETHRTYTASEWQVKEAAVA